MTDASESGGAAPGRSWTMLSPANASTRPSGSCVAVGYQRPTDMSGPRNHVFVTGLKIVVSASPSLAATCPPTKRVRPSASWTWPLQKRLRPYGIGREDPRLRVPEPLGVRAGIEPVERDDLSGRLQRHVHRDERPRDGRAPAAVGRRVRGGELPRRARLWRASRSASARTIARAAGRRGLLTQTASDAAILSVDLVNDYCVSEPQRDPSVIPPRRVLRQPPEVQASAYPNDGSKPKRLARSPYGLEEVT